MFGWSFRPTLVLAWDLRGTAQQPLQNFVEGRKEITWLNDIQITQAFAFALATSGSPALATATTIAIATTSRSAFPTRFDRKPKSLAAELHLSTIAGHILVWLTDAERAAIEAAETAARAKRAQADSLLKG